MRPATQGAHPNRAHTGVDRKRTSPIVPVTLLDQVRGAAVGRQTQSESKLAPASPKDIVVILPFCQSDVHCAKALLDRHVHMASTKLPFLVLCPDAVDESAIRDLKERADSVAERVEIVPQPKFPVTKHWPIGPNLAFLHANRVAMLIQARAFLFLEADCIPITRDWFKKLCDEYEKCGKRFMGTIVKAEPPLPPQCMNGVAVYGCPIPAFAIEFIRRNSKVPFDVALSSVGLLNECFDSKLIQFALGKNRTPIEWKSPSQVRRGAVLVHGDKSGDLIRILTSKENEPPTQDYSLTVPKLAIDITQPAGSVRWHVPDKSGSTFWHSGDLGDIIYALPLIKALGGGRLVLGPSKVVAPYVTREKMSRKRFDFIRPLLQKQSYLSAVEFSETRPEDAIDLNEFRLYIHGAAFDHNKNARLTSLPLKLMGVPSWIDCFPWLTVERLPKAAPVLFARSSRYHNPKFDWKRIHEKYKEQAVFVGLKEEYESFVRNVGEVKYCYVEDALELARHINSAELIVSNQTLALAIAVGLRKQVIVEHCWKSENCQFDYPGFQYSGDVELPDVEPSLPIEWHALYDMNSGIGRWAYNLAMAMQNTKLIWIRTRSDEAHTPHVWKVLSERDTGAARVLFDALPVVGRMVNPGDIVVTIWETDTVPQEIVESLNKARCVIVPSQFCLETFRRSGLTVPIHMAVLGVDTETFNTHSRKPREGPIRFGYAARWSKPCLDRKKPNAVITAFLSAVGESQNAVLELKGYGDCAPEIPNDDRISVITKFMPENELADWYRSLDFIINIATGGWELHVHEAMACGAIPIVIDKGGHREFVDTGCAIIVKSTTEDATGLYHSGAGKWFVPKPKSLENAIRSALTMDADKRAVMSKCAAENAKRFTWREAGSWLENIIKAYL